MSSIEKAETCTEKMHVRRLGMDQASIEANYKTIQDSVSALNEEKVKLNDLIVQYIKGLSLVSDKIHGPKPAGPKIRRSLVHSSRIPKLTLLFS